MVSQESYPKKVVISKDTFALFSIPQAAQIYSVILERNFYKEAYLTMDSLQRKNKITLDSVKSLFLQSESNYKQIVTYNEVDKKEREKFYQQELEKERNRTFWGKIRHFLIGGGSGALIVLFLK